MGSGLPDRWNGCRGGSQKSLWYLITLCSLSCWTLTPRVLPNPTHPLGLFVCFPACGSEAAGRATSWTSGDSPSSWSTKLPAGQAPRPPAERLPVRSRDPAVPPPPAFPSERGLILGGFRSGPEGVMTAAGFPLGCYQAVGSPPASQSTDGGSPTALAKKTPLGLVPICSDGSI